jgi:multiple sugar transport system substrate-binding protein
MVTHKTDKSPSPSDVGFRLDRRNLLKGAAGLSAAATLGLVVPGGIANAAVTPGSASGTVTLGSNYSDELPKTALAAAIAAFPNKNVTVTINTTDHNTYQENISTYLQNPDDVLAWFSGYRMRYFAAQDLLGPIDDVWAAGLNDTMTEGFKTASTGDDGKLYLAPWTYYAWGIHYRKSVFADNGWTVPTNADELMSLAENMKTKGITPFAFANDGRWPAMGTFDQLNFRMNGFQFHVDLMAGKEKWTDDRVKAVFTTWAGLLPYHQENPNGRTWQEAADTVVAKTSGMMTIGNFISQRFTTPADLADLDFFLWPEMNSEYGTGTVEAPIDGWMMAKKPKNPEGAKELLLHLGSAAAQGAALAINPDSVATAPDVDPSIYTALQKKAQETVAAAKNVTQFLDRDTSPEFASNVAGQALADFIADPTKIDSILSDMQDQATAIFNQ